MFCSNCGSQVEAGAAFCANCGAALNANSQASNGTVGGSQTANLHLEKAKNLSKGYFGYFMEHLKSPIRHGFAIDRSQWLNGLITLIIFTLFMGFSTYLVTRSLVSAFDLFGFSRNVSLMDALILPILYMAITLAIIIGVIFVVAKMMKSEANFQDVVARFGTFMLIPTVFILLTFLFGLLRIYALVSIVTICYMLSLICALVLTTYSYGKEHRGGLDPYYGILLAFLGLGFALLIFGDTLVRGFSGFNF